MSTRRALLAAGCGLAAACTGAVAQVRGASSEAALLPRPASLASELRRALAARKALVVLVSLAGCPYCKLVRESYLVPLRAEGQPVVQVEMDQSISLEDWLGRPGTHEEVVRALRVRVAPTVLFFGPAGREVAPRIAGMPIPDFYGAYLQERVDAANRSVAG